MLSIIFTTLYMLVAIAIAAIVILENRNPIKAISWVVVVLSIPAIGILLYFLLGQDMRRVKLIHRKVYKRISKIPYFFEEYYTKAISPQLSPRWETVANLCKRISNAPLLPAENVTIFTTGKEKFDALIDDITHAKHHIHLEYYTLESDQLGHTIADLLIAKVREGVKVRILYDDVGSWKTKKGYLSRLRNGGVQIYPFMEVVLPFFSSKVNYRNHRKIAVIDGGIGYVGGMNIADRYYQGNELGAWRDTHLRLQGAAVSELQSAFLIDWYLVTRRVAYFHDYFAPPQTPISENGIPMQLVLGAPIGKWRSIEQSIISMILHAQKSVFIETPYFLPTPLLNQALSIAALSGIDVRLIVPKKGDSKSVQYASFSYLEELLSAGVKIYLYQEGFLHSKLLTIDEDVCCIGSANMDFRSFEHNFECTAVFYNQSMTQQMNAIFEEDILRSEPVSLSRWKQRPRRQKNFESVMRLFSPLL